jgi:hypothetical protein
MSATSVRWPNKHLLACSLAFLLLVISSSSRAQTTIPLPQMLGDPIARPDSYSVFAGQPKTLDVLDNDEGVAQTAIIAIDEPASCGDAKPTEPDRRRILFDPKSCPVGTQSRFKYVIRQAAPAYGIVTVMIQAAPVPVPVPDVASTPFGQPIELDILANDQSVAPATVPTIVPNSGPACGILTPADGKRIRYDPQQCVGEATFEYCLDANPGCARARVTITIGPPPPVEPVNDAASTFVGEPVTVDVLRNDRRLPPSGVPLALEVLAQPGCGSVEVTADRAIRFDPETCAPRTVSFRYCVRVSSGPCVPADVVVTIKAHPVPKIDCKIPGSETKMIAIRGGRFVHNQAPQAISDIIAARDEDAFEVSDFCISAEPMPLSAALQYAQANGTRLWPADQPPPAPAILGPDANTPANGIDFTNATRIAAWAGQNVFSREISLPTLSEIIAAAWRVTATPAENDEARRQAETFLTALRSTARFWTKTPVPQQSANQYWVVGGPLEPTLGDPFVKIAREQEFQGRSLMFFFITR